MQAVTRKKQSFDTVRWGKQTEYYNYIKTIKTLWNPQIILRATSRWEVWGVGGGAVHPGAVANSDTPNIGEASNSRIWWGKWNLPAPAVTVPIALSAAVRTEINVSQPGTSSAEIFFFVRFLENFAWEETAAFPETQYLTVELEKKVKPAQKEAMETTAGADQNHNGVKSLSGARNL